MADPLDFAGLRAEVEAATILPEFDTVTRRAHRVRARGRLALVGAVLMVLAILGPAGYAAETIRVGPVAGPPLPYVPTAEATGAVRVNVTLKAAAGMDLDHVYALADVCQDGGSCDLRLTRLVPASDKQISPELFNLLRLWPTQGIDNVSLQALTGNWLRASADLDTGVRGYTTVRVDGAPASTVAPRSAVAAAQFSQYGPIESVDKATGGSGGAWVQPRLNQPRLVTGLGATDGVWTTGVDPTTGKVATSVTRDSGVTWTTATLDILATGDPPAFATYDGHVAYVLVRGASGLRLFETTDSGLSWEQRPGVLPWPSSADLSARYGMIVRPDGTLLTWLAASPATVYLASSDGGAQFISVTGPGGPIVALPDGYVSLGSSPALSRDGTTWTPTLAGYSFR